MFKTDKFRFAIDRGGIFTDIYAEVSGELGVRVFKRFSEDPKTISMFHEKGFAGEPLF